MPVVKPGTGGVEVGIPRKLATSVFKFGLGYTYCLFKEVLRPSEILNMHTNPVNAHASVRGFLYYNKIQSRLHM